MIRNRCLVVVTPRTHKVRKPNNVREKSVYFVQGQEEKAQKKLGAAAKQKTKKTAMKFKAIHKKLVHQNNRRSSIV